MNLWLATATATLFACCGIFLGCLFSRLPKSYWMVGYFIPIVLIFTYAVAVHFPVLSFTPPISWMMMGRKKFAVMGFIAALVLTTPLSRLPKKRDQIVVCALMAIMIFSATVWPFLIPALDRDDLAQLQTRMDPNGICLQTTDYTCGPAAAVTALRKLGFPAEEGKLAILSETSSVTGTPPDMLAEALQKAYGNDGLVAECRPFKDISELKQAGLTLAMVKYAFLVDHWVTVLQVTDSQVVIGDPLAGKVAMSYEDFSRKWRYVGIVLERKS
jgi:hypothetical protein